MSDKYILDENGHPIPCDDLIVWEKWFEKANRQLQRTELVIDDETEVTVSTVFLGMDHNFVGSKPLLYETMVFGGDNDGLCHRTSTAGEASRMHQVVVDTVINKGDTDE